MSEALFIHSDLDDAGLSLPAFRLLCHIARRTGKPGLFPGADSMAKVCRMDKKTVFRALQELEERGIVGRISRPGRTNEYSIRPMGTWGAKRVDPNGTPGGQTGRGVGCQTGRHPTQMAPHEDTPIKDIHKENPILSGFLEPDPVKPEKKEPDLTTAEKAVNAIFPEKRKPLGKFSKKEKQVLEALGLAESEILQSAGMMAKAKREGWEFRCHERSTLINKWESQVTSAGRFLTQQKRVVPFPQTGQSAAPQTKTRFES